MLYNTLLLLLLFVFCCVLSFALFKISIKKQDPTPGFLSVVLLVLAYFSLDAILVKQIKYPANCTTNNEYIIANNYFKRKIKPEDKINSKCYIIENTFLFGKKQYIIEYDKYYML